MLMNENLLQSVTNILSVFYDNEANFKMLFYLFII